MCFLLKLGMGDTILILEQRNDSNWREYGRTILAYLNFQVHSAALYSSSLVIPVSKFMHMLQDTCIPASLHRD